MDWPAAVTAAPTFTREDELNVLKGEADRFSRALEDLNERIRRIESVDESPDKS